MHAMNDFIATLPPAKWGSATVNAPGASLVTFCAKVILTNGRLGYRK
jgi:hypothetical protein